MSGEVISARVRHKGMTKSEWESSDVILLESEIGFETDTGFARAGDGHNRFSDLGYISPLDYNLLTNKPNIDGLATKVETAQKLQQKADKETVYTKAESKQELDKKLNLKGGVMTGQLKFKPAATVAYSSSTGGAVNIDLSSSRGAGVVVYSNNDASDGPLMSLRTGKETFNQSALFVDYSGKTNAVNIAMRQPSTPNFSSALNITSGNENGSAMQLRGSEKALGTLKITHENPSIKADYDKNAAALSIDIVKKTNGAGTAAQGIYINSTSGTTGKLLRIRNKNEDKFYVGPDGGFHSGANSTVAGNLTVNDPTSSKHAATKKYVDEKIAELKKLIQKTD
ncbi:TPA: hyaluronidase HylP [Streptococcus pyogenes]|uniref:hyaluronidase HylP n=1 Tax=Streptococcus pyogenes TaxID=1314 RepID=UPI000514245D|nr:hyaluronidase HylP [Streptococcus pyogenes]KGE59490.1 hyaluronidase-phage associated [Streptococcus pyogenes MGAS2111]QBX18871.1 hyaluronate lyase [Streptococcus phage Javan451]VHE41903.1 phage hyaluronoglucosaminidase [Streptococcus pyogenes]HEQ9219751.1 hyaluronidase HylP [Streptococcus pyogenes]HES5548371.1 hyaluronidase HylP [Streptococcus pyogenes]